MNKIEAIVAEIKASDSCAITVVYHDNCSDGFGSAWAAVQALGKDVKLVPAQHQNFDFNQLTGDHLVIADFAFDLKTLLDLQRKFKHVLVLDHHKTHAADLAEFGSAVYDVNRSGAGITWDVLVGGKRPRIIDYVEDRDLWKHKLAHVAEVSCVIETAEKNLATWDRMAKEMEDDTDFRMMIAMGGSVLEFKRTTMEEIAQRARMVQIGGYEVPSVNANRCFISDLGSKLAVGHPFAAVWSQGAQGQFMYSLRSSDEGIDCGAVAEKYGGGGHRNAAAFRSDKIFD